MPKEVKLDTFHPLWHKLKPSIESKLDTLLKDYASQFVKNETSIGITPLTEMTIDMGTSDLVSQKPYPIAMKNYQWVKDEIEKLLTSQKVILSSRSIWSAPIMVVPKGDGGKWLVIDDHTLNKVTTKFTGPMPKVEDIFSKLNDARYFSTLDLWAGYHHIPLEKSSIPRTTINSPFGKYEYVKVHFGLTEAPAYFQELMTSIVKDFSFAIAYLDDIIIFSKTVEEHLSYIKQVWETMHCNLNEGQEMPLLFKRNTIFRTHSQYQGYPTITFKDTSHPEHASTQNVQTSLCLPWISRVLQKIHQGFCKNS